MSLDKSMEEPGFWEDPKVHEDRSAGEELKKTP